MIFTLKKYISYFQKIKKDIYLIDSDHNKDFLIESLVSEKIIGIDTEFEWRNTYFPKVSLLQIATKTQILLIDCIKVKNLNFLKKILEDEEKLIILHSSRSDATVLSTNLNIKLKNTYDIQIAEKNLSKGEIKNYASIVKKYFFVHLKKTETNSNWLKRPFTEDQLSYAADDVNYLLEIYFKQKKILNKNILYQTFKESKIESNLGNQELYISRMKRLKKPSKMEKKIFLWREQYASDLNIPTSYVFKNNNLKKILFLFQSKKNNEGEIKKFFGKAHYGEDFIKLFKN